MSLLSEFFLGSAPSVRQLDCLEISHPNFTQIYRIVRNSGLGVSVTHEGPAGPFTYTYFPMRIKPIGSGSDLTQALSVTLGDLGDVIVKEVAAITAANAMDIRPVAKFRTYRSDDLTQPLFGPLILEMSRVTTSEEGSSFECHAPLVNNSRTGILYIIDEYPMIRGFF